jgi:hypothetical protein
LETSYGLYVYQFDHATGQPLKAFTLPSAFAVTHLRPVGATETSGNTSGRVANKSMEGLAITPDGKMLVSIMQAQLIQDGSKTVTLWLHSMPTGAPVTRFQPS